MNLSSTQAFKELLKFSLPIILGHLGIMLIATGDMVIAGRYSTECLAAIGLAVSMANPVMMLGLGVMFAISPILAQKRGRGEEIASYYWSVIFYSIIVGIVCTVFTMLSIKLLPYFGYAENLNEIIREYLWISSFSTVGNCIYQAVKEFYQSQEKTISANLLALVAVGVNLFFNYAFAFGEYGMPRLAEAGLAWASLMVRMFMGLGMIFISYEYWKSPFKIKWDIFSDITKLGFPISIAIFFEVLAFCSVTLFVGKFDAIQVAANNIALNIGSLAFMIPLSIAGAVAVKVGHAYGEKNLARIKIFSRVSLFTSIGFTIIGGSCFYFFPEFILKIYNDDPAVLAWGKTLLFWVACFQLFDGAQITMAGILRGLNVTRASTISIFIGYWLIGIPLGYYLGFYTGLEAQGFWMGLALSLAVVAVLLKFVLRHKMKALSEQGFQWDKAIQ